MVEHIAVKYDAAWRAGWTSEDALWLNPYCEGLIEATAFMDDEVGVWAIKKAVVEYCNMFGYMCDKSQRPSWMNTIEDEAA